MLSWQDLDLNQPLNQAHPLNRGRAAWWLAMPWQYGTNDWPDLVQGANAVLTSLATGYGWNTASSPGGAGSILFDGVNGYVASADRPSLRPSNLTVGAWVNFNAWGTGLTHHSAVLCKSLYATGGGWSAPFCSYLLRINTRGTSGIFGASPGNTYKQASVTYTFSLNTWYRLYGCYDGSQLAFYAFSGGKLVASATTAATGAITYNAQPLYLGTDGESASNNSDRSNCWLSDVFVSSRPWSLAEMQADFLNSQIGYPDILNYHEDGETLVLFPTSGSHNWTVNTADNLASQDQAKRLTTAKRTLTDALAFQDAITLSALLLAVIRVSDSLALNDPSTLYLSAQHFRALIESLGNSDTVRPATQALRRFSDNLGLTDSLTAFVQRLLRVADSLGINDQVQLSRATALLLHLLDNLGESDSSRRTVNGFRKLTDNLALTDQVKRLTRSLRSFTDSLAVSDTLQRSAQNKRLAGDSLGVNDQVQFSKAAALLLLHLLDNLGESDRSVQTVHSFRQLADNLGLSDHLNRLVGILLNLVDALGTTDQTQQLITLLRLLADSFGTSDTLRRFAQSQRSASDNLGLGDLLGNRALYSRHVTDQAGLSENLLRQILYSRLLQEQLAVTDQVSFGHLAGLVIHILDNLGLTDSFQATTVILRFLADQLAGTDREQHNVTFGRQAIDNLGLNEEYSQGASYSRLLVDNLALADLANRAVTAFRFLQDNLGLADSLLSRIVPAVLFVRGNKLVFTARDPGRVFRGQSPDEKGRQS